MTPKYELIDLGRLPNGTHSKATGINALGHVVGWADTDDRFCDGFIWDGTSMTPLGTSRDNDGSRAIAVNDLGEVIGFSMPPFIEVVNGRKSYRPFAYRAGKLDYIPVNENYWLSLASINNTSEITGVLETNEPERRVRSLKIHKGQMTVITADGWQLDGEFHAAAINDHGQIAGGAYTEGWRHAALWHDNVVTDLGSLGRWSMARDISSLGQVVGSSETHEEDEIAFFWNKSELISLGTLPTRSQSMANAINDHSQIVGESCRWEELIDFHDPHAFLWHDGEIIDLNDIVIDLRGFELQSAVDINNKGQIVCNAQQNGIRRAILLNPR
jgi:probable HAF family extracellular repeat protein